MKYAQGLLAMAVSAGAMGAADATKQADAAATDAQRIYNEACVACHAEGVRGAPRPGVKSDWEERLTYGLEELYLNTVDGLGTDMPPRGLCLTCSDAKLVALSLE